MIQNRNRKRSYRQDNTFSHFLSSSRGMAVSVPLSLALKDAASKGRIYENVNKKTPNNCKLQKPNPQHSEFFYFLLCASAGCPPLRCRAVQRRAVAGLPSAVVLPSTVVVGARTGDWWC